MPIKNVLNMSNRKIAGGIVYSTNPEFKIDPAEEPETDSLAPEKQDLRVMLDRKQRKGKVVTLITGFRGSEEELKELGKILKAKCGTGGSVKDGEIMIQGDFKIKIGEILKNSGFRFKFSGGN